MDDKTFVYIAFIKTTPEKLWEALTDSSFIEQYWFGSSFETDWKVGSKIVEIHKNGKQGFHGEILKSNPPKLLSYSFMTSAGIKTVVTFEIESIGDTVTLRTTQVGYDRNSTNYKSTSVGWAAIHSGLKTLLETNEALDGDSVYGLYDKLTENQAETCS